jgi:hypothetical protein
LLAACEGIPDRTGTVLNESPKIRARSCAKSQNFIDVCGDLLENNLLRYFTHKFSTEK